MAALFNPLSLVRQRPIIASVFGLTIGLVLLLIYLRYWITTDSGRDFVISQIDGRNVAGYGSLSVRNLDGDPLSDFTVGNIAIRDASGDWLTAESVRIVWSPSALLSRTIDLEAVSIAEVKVQRRPSREPQPETDSKSWEIRLDQGRVDRLLIAEGVAGSESASSIDARFINERSGSIDARLELKPLDGAGDQITAKIIREKTSDFDVTIDGTAPAGGIFAHLLGLPERASATVAAKASGNLEAGLGEATLTIDGTDKVFLSGKIENRQLEASARIDASALPVQEALADFLGSAAEADLSAAFEDDRIKFHMEARIATGVVSLSGVSANNQLKLLEPAAIDAQFNSLAPYWGAAQELSLSGFLEQGEGVLSYSGDTELSVLSGAGLPFEALRGPLSAKIDEQHVLFSGDVVIRNLLSSNAEIAKIIGQDVRVSGNGAFNLATRRLVVNAAEVTHKSGDAQLLGEMSFVDSQINVSGKVTQALAALPGGLKGRASGFVQAKGPLRDLELGLNLNLEDLASDIESVNALIMGRGSLRGLVQIKPETGTAKRVDFKLQGIEGRLSGPIYGPGSPDLQVLAQQLAPISISGNLVDLGSISARLRKNPSGFRLDANSEGGSATISGRTVSDLSAIAGLAINGSELSGPVRLTGRVDGLASAMTFFLNRTSGVTRFENVAGTLGAIGLKGSAALSDEGGIEADLDVEAGAFEYAGISVGSFKVAGQAGKSDDDATDIGARFEATMVKLTSDLTIDALTGTFSNTPGGYRFEGRLLDKQTGADSDVKYSGLLSFEGAHPSGTLALSGTLLGIGIKSQDDIVWALGPAPEINADLALLGGTLKALIRPGNDDASSTLTLSNLKVAPLLGALGLPEVDAVISGRASGRVFGENPEGTLSLSATSAVSGLDTELEFDLSGRLDPRNLTLTAEASYGPKLKANAAARLPVATSRIGMVQLDRTQAVEGLADVNGNLDTLRLAALAFGHDVGGMLTSRFELRGTLEAPEYKADVDIADGVYEYGATGMSLKDLDLKATYTNQVWTLTGTGLGANGGTLKLNGRLAEDEAGVAVDLNRILVYDRLGDQARLSGTATLVEGEKDRVLNGNLSIDDARFNIDNFSSGSIRTLNVRWTTDDPASAENTVLEKPIRLGLKVTAPRGVFIRGRGLDSDWGVNLDVSGQPDKLLLNGRATLSRGSLELAQRPFEFESGTITFDGPIESARMAISATREVDGFSVRADVAGAPARPTVELSSSPSLPEDEILSRMLFGRSSVDLTALEAAELATSIARLAGQDTGIDPIGIIQAGLGVDRLRFGVTAEGNAEVGVGQYLAPDVYLEVTTQGAEGNSVEVEWQPRPQVSVSSATSSTGDSRVSVRWKKDY